MSVSKVNVYELIAWDLDEYPYRDSATGRGQEELAEKVERAHRRLAEREDYASCSALLLEETQSIRHLLDVAAQREDMKAEYEGLEWTLGVVDLRCLLAFQRRLVFSETHHILPNMEQDDWPQLVSLALGARRSTEYGVVRNGDVVDGLDVTLHSSNPDLQLKLVSGAGAGLHSPFTLYGGSPFLEVAELGGRWFLRDGYHRAYRLLQAGLHHVPAVVIRARTMEQVGATEPWFFGEEQMFSVRPPRVMDFLDESLVLHYERTALRKVIRIRIEESLRPMNEHGEVQGDEQ